MRSCAFLSSAALLTGAATASFDGNLNYHSPSRRHAGLGINVPLVSRRSWKRENNGYDPSELSFTHGVASGDPYPESVILWTRVAPTEESSTSNVTVEGDVRIYSHETEAYIKADANPICVDFKVFEEDGGEASDTVVVEGRGYTTSDIDFTLKVEADGLKPFTQYYYQFSVCDSDNKSPMGRTKTSPAEDDDVSEIDLAVFSCSNFPTGYFNAYGNAARKDDHDYVVHLGDYIYESAGGDERPHNPDHAIFSLHDYRTRHGQYRSDLDLQLLAQKFAWIPTWDDHEIANNGYRDGFSALNNTEDSFLNDGPQISVDSRKVHAVRAYFEWMPIRQVDLDDNLRIWRSFKMGKLLDLIILDTRNYDRSITSLGWNDDYIDLIRDDPSRSIMGPRQESWFYNSLSESSERGAAWRIIGNQLIFSRLFENDDGGMSGDNWNGYIANRNRTLKHLYDNEISNSIFLAGDSHQNWVSDLAWLGTKDYDSESGKGAIGVEFAGTAVTSTGQTGPIEPNAGNYSRGMVGRNEEMQWQEGYYRGYFRLAVTPEQATAQFYGSPTVATRNSWDIPLANFTVKSGENHLARPIADGRVESGALRLDGEVLHSNLTMDTETGEWQVIGFDQMYLKT